MSNDVEDIATRAADKAVKNVLLQIGIDVDNPIDAQKDFYLMREAGKLASDHEFRKDLQYIRSWRLKTESVTTKGLLLVFTMFLTGILTSAWLGFQQLINK